MDPNLIKVLTDFAVIMKGWNDKTIASEAEFISALTEMSKRLSDEIKEWHEKNPK